MKLMLLRKKTTRALLATSLAVALIQGSARGANPPGEPPTVKPAETNSAFPDKKERLSYAVGMNMGAWLKRNEYDLNMDLFASALKDAMAGQQMKMTDNEAMKEMQGHSQELMAKRREEQRKLAEKNTKAAEEWLAANKQKPGVKTEMVKAAGPGDKMVELQYKVITEGNGPAPKTNDQVTVVYHGRTIEGKEFDSSTKRPGAGKFSLNVTPRFGGPSAGLLDAIRMMSVGSKWEVYVPPALGFGTSPGPGGVEPGSAVIYEVELVSIDSPQPLTSDIIRVPSAEELKNGAKVEVLKPEDVARLTQGTNGAAPKK